VACTYPGPPPVEALQATDLMVACGEYAVLSGPSGSGKSTLLNMLALLDRPTAGVYRFEGIATQELSDRERTSLRAHRIGVVFQAFHLMAYRNAIDNVGLGLLYVGASRAVRNGRALVALDRVNLTHRAEAFPTTMSGGERQRVAIARALVGEPTLLLCDEPTGNLDSASTAAVLDVLDSLHDAGLTILVITHDAQVAARARRRFELRDGVLREVSYGNVDR
jgi:putative ABC transport system ATP-binding protein